MKPEAPDNTNTRKLQLWDLIFVSFFGQYIFHFFKLGDWCRIECSWICFSVSLSIYLSGSPGFRHKKQHNSFYIMANVLISESIICNVQSKVFFLPWLLFAIIVKKCSNLLLRGYKGRGKVRWYVTYHPDTTEAWLHMSHLKVQEIYVHFSLSPSSHVTYGLPFVILCLDSKKGLGRQRVAQLSYGHLSVLLGTYSRVNVFLPFTSSTLSGI